MPQRFEYPLSPVPVLRTYEASESFPIQPSRDVEALALPANLLGLGLMWSWHPLYPVVVFTGESCGTLTPEMRDRVWQRWGLPVFEYRLDASGAQVVAEECEAHDGLHLRREVTWPEGPSWTRCACGLDTPRLFAPRHEELEVTTSLLHLMAATTAQPLTAAAAA